MTKLFLILHVLTAVVAVGPITVAASMFPPALRRARRTSEARDAPAAPDTLDARDALSGLRMLHRICRVYAAVGLAVPVFGFATASSLGVLGSGWLIVSILLTAAAAAVLALMLLPAQARELAALQEPARASGTRATAGRAGAGRLAMLTGVFNLLWATVTVLMIIRPGSTTGV